MIASSSFLPLHVSNDQFPRGWDCQSKYEMERTKYKINYLSRFCFRFVINLNIPLLNR